MLTDTLHDATPQLRGALDGVANLSRSLNKRDEALRATAGARQDGVRHAGAARRSGQPAGHRRQPAVRRARRAAPGAEHPDRAASSGVSQQLSGFVADNKREFGPALKQAEPGAGQPARAQGPHRRGAASGCPAYATALGEVVGPVPASTSTCTACRPATISEVAARHLLPAGQAAGQPRRLCCAASSPSA